MYRSDSDYLTKPYLLANKVRSLMKPLRLHIFGFSTVTGQHPITTKYLGYKLLLLYSVYGLIA